MWWSSSYLIARIGPHHSPGTSLGCFFCIVCNNSDPCWPSAIGLECHSKEQADDPIFSLWGCHPGERLWAEQPTASESFAVSWAFPGGWHTALCVKWSPGKWSWTTSLLCGAQTLFPCTLIVTSILTVLLNCCWPGYRDPLFLPILCCLPPQHSLPTVHCVYSCAHGDLPCVHPLQ